MTSGGSLNMAYACLERTEPSSREVREVDEIALMSDESRSSGVSSG